MMHVLKIVAEIFGAVVLIAFVVIALFAAAVTSDGQNPFE